MSQVVTGEAVPVELRVARIGSRAPAALLDVLIQLVMGVALAVLLRPILSRIDAALQAAVVLAAYVTLVLGYPVISETLWHGRTLGKAAMGVRVVRDDGGPIRFRHALVRGLLGTLVELPGVSFGVVAVVCSLLSSRGKRLGDVLAGTVVVHTRVPQTAGVVPLMPPVLAGWAVTLDLSRLGDDLALACRQFMGRAATLTPEARERLGSELVAAVARVVTPAPPAGTPGWAYLAAVLAERRRCNEQRAAQQTARHLAHQRTGWRPDQLPEATGTPAAPTVAGSSAEPPPPGPFAPPG